METRPHTDSLNSAWYGGVFVFIFLCAASLRLWRLDIPSLWFDEVMVAMVAKLPVWSIFQRSLIEDFHPPTFYLLTKLVMSAGASDFVLRLPQVLFGLTGIWFVWRAGREMLSEGAGLLLAAFVSLQPWHLLLSRQLRPYSIVFLFGFMGLYFLWRAIRDNKTNDFVWAGLSLWPPVLLHFSGLLAVGGAGLIVLIALLRGRVSLPGAALFCLVSGVAVACVLPFASSLFRRESGITGGGAYQEVIGSTVDRIGELLSRESYPVLRLTLAILSGTGLVVMFRQDRLLALISTGWFLLPLLVLVLVRYSTYFNPWHLTFLLPPLLLWQAQAVRTLVGEKYLAWAAVGFSALGSWWFLSPAMGYYYDAFSYSGEYKSKAVRILEAHASDVIYVYPQSSISGPLNWYLDQLADPNPLRQEYLGTERASVRLVTLEDESASHNIGRQPVMQVGLLPFECRITASPDDFLRHVDRMEYVACQPVLENILIATRTGQPGFAEFRFENQAGGPQSITVHFGYSNRKEGNIFAVRCRFNDEPWSVSFVSTGLDIRKHEKIELIRTQPYSKLIVRLELCRMEGTPSFTGEDLEAVRFVDLKVQIQKAKK